MCNIAGYVGTERAAPILIEMLRRQEGLNAGYYTGIATIHAGKIHYAKLTGDLDRLIAETNAAELPGTIGIIHGRTESGGGDAWSHPFLSFGADGAPSIAYVANGSAGIFAPRNEEFCRLAETLIAQGYAMSSQVYDAQGYQTLSDGSSVHMSDVMCQLIRKNLDTGKTTEAAMTDAFCAMPSEIVGLLLSLAEPDCITWSRINMPMMIGFAPHGAYLASASLAFPDDAGEPQLLPACASGQVWRDRCSVVPYPAPPARVAPLNARIRSTAYEAVCDELGSGTKTFIDLIRRITPLFDEGDCFPRAALTYEVLYALKQQGRLKIDVRRVPGVVEGLEAPLFDLALA